MHFSRGVSRGRIRVILVVVLLGLCLLLSGCWDRRELQERNFVLAVGIDYADQPSDSKEKAEQRVASFVQPHGKKVYQLSLQVLNISPSGGSGGGSGGDSGAKGTPRQFVIANTGQTMFEMVRDLSGQVGRSLWFEHIQAIVINEEILKQDGIKPIIDFFSRDSEMRARVRVITTPGQARKILEYKTPNGEPSGLFLNNLLRNHIKNTHLMGAKTDVGFVLQYLANKTDFVLPRAEIGGEVLKVGGGVLIKKDKMVGTMDEYTTKGVKLIRATEKSALITVTCPEHPQNVFTFELFQHDTKLTPHIEGDNIYFTLDIYMIGNIGELQRCPGEGHEGTDNKFLREMEVAFAEEVERNVLHSWHTTQDYQVDVLAAGAALKAYEPKTWEKVKDNWDEIFATVPLIPSVNVTIRGTGERN
ncbi:spore germination protein YndF [Sporomusaceae bacterium FL31]|nr:spore germination protein YndF [Sporomusaceae bacterium FL31]GCE34810.1 spore germination protein YndF [Sporomusaceae bacterium]